MTKRIPQKGDFVSYFPTNQIGHEQKGRRPGLVISNNLFNESSELIFICPITSTINNFPFHIIIPEGEIVTGVVMTEQLRAVDYRSRKVSILGSAQSNVVEKVVALIDRIIR